LCRVIARCEILRRRFVRIGLTLVVGVNLLNTGRAGFGFFDVGVNFVLVDAGVAGLGHTFHGLRFVRTAQRFSRKNFHRRSASAIFRGGHRRLLVPVSVIVVLEIFENVADVQEGIAVQADVHECRLHAGKNASDSAFVDAADQRELFFALDVDFD
jgi:hypothetical protein